jgi:hypothetical protein
MTAIYRAFLDYAVPTVTTLAGAQAAIEGVASLQRQQQVVVIALHRRFMRLGGSGIWGDLSTAGCHTLRYSKWGRHAGLWPC